MWGSSVKVVFEAKGVDEILRRLYNEKWTLYTTWCNVDIERDARREDKHERFRRADAEAASGSRESHASKARKEDGFRRERLIVATAITS